MKKTIVIFCLLVLLSSIFAFAQNEREGTVIGTMGIGGGFGTIVETIPQFSFVFDVNFVSKTGFTLCLTTIVNARQGALGPSQNLMFGAGYTFMRDNWYVGGALIAAPTTMDLMLGGKINGGYFFTNDLGVTSIVTYRRTAGISGGGLLSMFDVFAGISIRFL